MLGDENLEFYTAEQYSQDPIYYTQLMQQQANEWSAQQAQKQMDFQERMANTAHQREIADLKAAGLNPVLSAHTNGATTPNGASTNGDTSSISVVADLMSQMIAADTAKSIAAGRGGGYSYGISADPKGNYRTGLLGMIFQDLITGATDTTPRQLVAELGRKGIQYLKEIFSNSAGTASEAHNVNTNFGNGKTGDSPSKDYGVNFPDKISLDDLKKIEDMAAEKFSPKVWRDFKKYAGENKTRPDGGTKHHEKLGNVDF